MSVFDHLARWVGERSLAVLRFNSELAESLRRSSNGLQKFTFAELHSEFEGLRPPTLCLTEVQDESYGDDYYECYIGIVTSKAAITTFDSRLTVVKLREVNLTSLESLVFKVPKGQYRRMLRNQLPEESMVSVLSPKLSSSVIEVLAADSANKSALEAAASNLPGLRIASNPEWEQIDAVQTAMAAFGINKSAIAETVAVREGASSTLGNIGAHVFEDNVIIKDSSVLPGFSLIDRDLTGRAVFEKRGERLEVYTANRGPLEEMFGVDLIYVNDSLGNIVMIQYKMLEEAIDGKRGSQDWIFRPDEQLRIEISRMELPPVVMPTEDYRLSSNPFYFKFVKRRNSGEARGAFFVSLEHLNQLLELPKAKGPRGGIRLSYNVLEGVYLREADILSLIRSGYIGTHRTQTEFLRIIISAALEGNRALVLAWQGRS